MLQKVLHGLLNTRSVCVVRATVDNISTDTERRAGLSAIADCLLSLLALLLSLRAV